MEEIIGRIEKKAEGQAKTGAKFLTYTIDGKNYNTFEEKFFDFNVGEIVKVGLEQNGKYKNVVSMDKSTEQPGQQKPNVDLKTTIDMVHGVVLNKTEKPHSYEFGKAGSRHKIYYADVKELEVHIEALKTIGLIDDVEIPEQPTA